MKLDGLSQPGLRRATLDDIAAIASIHRIAFFVAMPAMPTLHTPEDDVAYFTNIVFPKTEIWLAERSGSAAGFIALRHGWVDHLYIHPKYQNQGLGSALLAGAQSSMDSLHLWTFQCNQRARRFYENHGFQIERETDGAGNDEGQPDVLYHWTRDKVV